MPILHVCLLGVDSMQSITVTHVCPLCEVHTLPTVHGVLVVAIASRPPSQAGRGSYGHKLAMSICTLCYLYSLALCYKSNRKSKLEESHFDQLSSVQRGRGPGETF